MSNWLATKLTGMGIHDMGCTLKAYRREAVRDLELYGEMHRYIPALISWRGFRVTEVKVRHHKRMHGRTKYGILRLFKGFLDLLVVTFWQRYSGRPIHIFGGLGLVLGSVGMLLVLYMIFQRMFLNVGLSERPLFLLAILMVIIGMQFIVSGVLADIMVKIYYRDGKRNLIERVIE
jgi:hypothetical protein